VRSELERIDLFSDLGAAAQAAVSDVARVRTYDDGALIMIEGDPASPVFFVLEGTVRVYRTNLDGREQTLIHATAGTAFNVPTAFHAGNGAPASATAVGATRLLAIPRQDFRRLASETPEIALAVMADLSTKLHHLTSLTYDLSLRSVRGRLARFLLAHAEVDATSPVRWTHAEIAAQIGTVREVVSRTLRAFIREGRIGMDRQRIVVLDRDALAREAES
jgi:CRP/FNR family transcriptional regulator